MNPFKRWSDAQNNSQAGVGTTDCPTEHTAVYNDPTRIVRKSQRKASEFQIELGELEKYLLEGKLVAQRDMVLKVYGNPSDAPLKSYKQSKTEVYEGNIGQQEKLFVRVERDRGFFATSKSKVRISVNGRLVQTFEIRPERTTRHTVFQNVMPCLFLAVVGYYAFIYRPEVAQFYSQILSRPQAQPKARQQGLPNQNQKQQQVVQIESCQQFA